MEGSGKRRQAIEGFPALGHVAAPGIYPASLNTQKPTSRRELFRGAESRAKFDKKQPSGHSSQLWADAAAQVGKGGRGGPFLCMANGKLSVNGRQVGANPGSRFGVPLADKLSSVDDLR